MVALQPPHPSFGTPLLKVGAVPPTTHTGLPLSAPAANERAAVRRPAPPVAVATPSPAKLAMPSLVSNEAARRVHAASSTVPAIAGAATSLATAPASPFACPPPLLSPSPASGRTRRTDRRSSFGRPRVSHSAPWASNCRGSVAGAGRVKDDAVGSSFATPASVSTVGGAASARRSGNVCGRVMHRHASAVRARQRNLT